MLLSLKNITKKFPFTTVLNDIDFDLNYAESVALIGESGAGKSTLLQIAGLLDTPTQGTVTINGINTSQIKDDKKTEIRCKTIGFVYQFHNLLPDFTAVENVMLPLLIAGISKKDANNHAKETLELVGLSDKACSTPKMLSGGEQQRVAIARAIAHNPQLIIADEPTGNLDNRNSEIVFELFLQIIKTQKTALLMATHNTHLAKRLSKQIEIKNGVLKIAEEGLEPPTRGL